MIYEVWVTMDSHGWERVCDCEQIARMYQKEPPASVSVEQGYLVLGHNQGLQERIDVAFNKLMSEITKNGLSVKARTLFNSALKTEHALAQLEKELDNL
jgi:hypothetical protein